jgi:hypothetical protein
MPRLALFVTTTALLLDALLAADELLRLEATLLATLLLARLDAALLAEVAGLSAPPPPPPPPPQAARTRLSSSAGRIRLVMIMASGLKADRRTPASLSVRVS